VKVDVTFPDNPDEPCATVLNISFTRIPIPGGEKVIGFVVFSNLTECPCNITIEIVAIDCCGQTGSNSQTAGVEDMTSPDVTFTDPFFIDEDFETPADAGGCTALVELAAIATDNCDGAIDPAKICFVIDTDGNGFDPGDPLCGGGGGGSDCCLANGTPGCDDAECEALICAIDPFCCDVAWDSICADEAQDLCEICTCGSPCSWEFPVGTTGVRAMTTDSCGNVGYKDVTVTVIPYNEMVLDISLQSVFVPWTIQCTHFELYGCDGAAGGTPVDLNLTYTSPGAPTDANFTGTVLIPCGPWACATAAVRPHTLRRAIDGANFQIVGTQYVATFPDSLLGGNYDEFLNYPNPFIDVGDFSVWAAEFQNQATYNSSCPGNPDGCTPCGETNPPHADGTGDGLVLNAADFTFIQINWLLRHEECCAGAAPADGPATPGWAFNKQSAYSKNVQLPILQLNVAVLTAQGHGELAAADLNGDGWIDMVDVLMVTMDQMAGTGLP
jgi:hypothetical protein